MVDRLFEKYGFRTVDLAIGDHVADLRNTAEGQSELIKRLYHRWSDGHLRLRSSGGRVLHTKLYLLSSSDSHRALAGSANFTETGWGGRQVNHMVGVDVPTGSLPALLQPDEAVTLEISKVLYAQIEADYEEHLKICSDDVFESLSELMQDGIPESRAIDIWVSGASGQTPSAQIVFSAFAKQLSDAVAQAPEELTGPAIRPEGAQTPEPLLQVRTHSSPQPNYQRHP